MAFTRSEITIRYRNRHRDKVNAWRRLNHARKMGRAEPSPPRQPTYVTLAQTERRAFVKWLKDVPCTDCGIRYPFWVMEFDHVRGIKQFNLGGMNCMSQIERWVDELLKCEVVCSNCHQTRTYLNGGSVRASRRERKVAK